MTATSSSAKEPATSSASARAAWVTWAWVVNGVSVAVSSEAPKGLLRAPGAISATMSLLAVAGDSADRARLARMFQPRAPALATCPAAVTAILLCSALWPNSRTYGLCAAGVVSAGAEEAGSSLPNRSLPFGSKERWTSFSWARRSRKSQSVMLGWVASS